MLVAFVSDGAGSASHGGEGASLICRTLAELSRVYFRENDQLPSDAVLFDWVDAARDRIWAAAKRRGLMPRDFAGTLVGAISTGASSVVAHVGDGCAAVLDANGKWSVPSWPEHGEYASTTHFVTDDVCARLRIERVEFEIVGLAVLSDGLERLALQFSDHTPFAAFFDGMAKPLLASKGVGRDRGLSGALRRYLESDAINSRTDDDKSIVLAVRA